MSRPKAIWQVAEPKETTYMALAESLGISRVVAQILCNRGLEDSEQAKRYLASNLKDLHDPFMLKGMNRAVEEIIAAIESGSKVIVYGDYDADGVTSTTLLLDALEKLGCGVGFYLPDRLEEGYGLNKEALAQIAAQGYKLVVTVDCGIGSVAEVEYAREIGLRVIITDHHEPPELLPKAEAIINPKQQACPYPFKDLAGVGVAFKLAQALAQKFPDSDLDPMELLDLVTIGTIADMVPMLGENRIFVRHGLPRLAASQRVGIRSLLEVAELESKRIGPGQVGFALAPRINATGRIGDAGIAVRLLRSNDALRAREMAAYLDSENRARQEIEAEIFNEALEMLGDYDPERDKFLVLASKNWHSGVVGIVASRLVEKFYRPVILIAIDEEEGKGSGRSVSGFNLYDALCQCSELLLKFGGHKQAAGLSIKADNIEELRQRLNHIAGLSSGELFVPKLRIDAQLGLGEISDSVVQEIENLEPFGIGNETPLLLLSQGVLTEAREVGKNKNHLKVRFKHGSVTMDGIGFGLAHHLELLDLRQPVEAAVTPGFNEYKGKTSIQLQVKDIRNRKPVVSVTYPLTQVLNQVKMTGLPALMIYPLPQIAAKMAGEARDMAKNLGLRFKEQYTACPPEELLAGADIVYTTPVFLGQDVAKLRGMSVVVIDSIKLSPEVLDSLAKDVELIHSDTSRSMVKDYAPSRERLAELYKALRSLARPDGSLGPDLHTTLSVQLSESISFVETGFEIFEELNIIKRINTKETRIIYFQAPKEKLDLLQSKRFVEGQRLLTEFTLGSVG